MLAKSTPNSTTPEDAVRIPLMGRDGSLRGHAIVAVDDFAYLNQWTWRLYSRSNKRTPYVYRFVPGDPSRKRVWMHREVLNMPEDFDGFHADHINGDGLDNRRSNLRVVTASQNAQNTRSRIHARSIFRGVSFHQGRWRVRMKLHGRSYHVGCYDTEEQADVAAREWRAEHMPFASS